VSKMLKEIAIALADEMLVDAEDEDLEIGE
jgi:hypothetical protein